MTPSPLAIANNTASLTDRELREALFAGPGATSIEAYVAVDIITSAFDGRLLREEKIREAIVVDDGRAYINWDALRELASNLAYPDTSLSRRYPHGASIVLRVAVALGLGQITPSIARTLAGALAVAGGNDRPTFKK